MITRLKLGNGDGKEWECRNPFLVISSMDQFVRSPARQQSALLAEAENAPLRVATNTQGEVTSQNLWSRCDRHFVGIT